MKRIALILPLLLMTGISFATPSKEKPCEKKDILGAWKLVSMHVIAQKMARGPLAYKHQERVFHKNGEMQHFIAKTPVTQEMKKKFEKTPRTVRYSVGSPGFITVKVSKRTTDSFRCRVTNKGELMFTWPELGDPALVQRFKKAD